MTIKNRTEGKHRKPKQAFEQKSLRQLVETQLRQVVGGNNVSDPGITLR